MASDISRQSRGLILSALGALCAAACASTTATEAAVDGQRASAKGTPAPHADRSRCEYEGRADRDVVESAERGALAPRIRRVYLVTGEGDKHKRILICREVDTNGDGIKDVVRRYDDRGEPVEETADANFDGVIDTWIRFAKGRIVRMDLDHGSGGQPDETRYYDSGKLTRIERDTNHDGKTDVWEIYQGGQLVRMGVDEDHDGRVDRWNRDAASVIGAERSAAQSAPRGDASGAPKTGQP